MMDPRRTIDITATMANIFGCGNSDDIIDRLCEISDLAANVRIALVNSDIKTAVQDLFVNEDIFMNQFAEWEKEW